MSKTETPGIKPIYQHYVIDMSGNNNFVQVPSVQGDGNQVRILEVELIANGVPYPIDREKTIVNIAGTKPDSTHILNPCTVSENGCILVDITYQMSAAAGRGDYQIVLIDTETEKTIKSFPFHIVTTKSPMDAPSVSSSDEYQLLTEAVSKALADYEYVMDSAKSSADAAKASETSASASALSAENSAEQARSSASQATESSVNALDFARESEDHARKSEDYSETSKSYAIGDTGIRDGEETDNSKYYSEKSKEYSNSWKGSLLPKGSVPFAGLPSSGNIAGHMYNINEAFVTDSRFRDGAGYSYPAGTNVYRTSDNKWDCLSGTLTKVLTQAEYDALSNAEKMNGTTYYISDSDNSIADASAESAGLLSPADKQKLDGIAEGAEANVQADWNTADSGSDSYIKNKPSVYTKSEVDNKFSAFETAIDWKEAVATFADIEAAYPNPEDGWTVNVKDTDYTYRYNGRNWVVISANAIPKATQNMDGLLSKEDKTAYDDADSKKHTHENKSLLDRISVVNNTADKDKIVASAANADMVDGKHASDLQNYNNLTNKPVIPSVGNGTVTITQNGAAKGSFTMNQSGNTTIALTDTNTQSVTGIKGNAESSYRTGSVNLTPANIGLGNVGNFKAVSTVAGQNLTEAEKANARSNIGAGASSFSGSYNDLSNKPTIPAAVDGVNFNGKSDIIHYAICSTEGNKAEKTVSLPGFTLTNGARITVWFKNENTATGHTTLNVNGTGAKEILHEFTYANNFLIRQNGVYEFVYSGSYWMLEGHIVWVKGAAESSYRTGKVNLTAENVGALPLSGGTMEENADIILNGGKVSSSRNTLVFSSKTNSDTTATAYISIPYGGDGGCFSMLYNIGTTSMGNRCDLGANDRKWRNIYATNGVIQTSDRVKKTEIAGLTDDRTKAFIMGLNPVSYKMVDGTSGRTHYGLIAPEVEDLMTELGMDSKDFAGFIKSPKVIRKDTDEDGNPLKRPTEEIIEGEYDYALRYDEFIAPLIKLVQNQQKEIEILKEKLSIKE